MALRCFNESGSAFLQLTSDNRLTLWDTVSGALKQQFFEDDHLTANYTCLALVEPVKNSNKKQQQQKKRKVVNAGDAPAALAALGNTGGKIVVWDLKEGQIVHRLQADTSHINDLAFSPDGKRLYACSAGSTVDCWDLKSGELVQRLEADKHGVKRICVSTDGSQLLSASSTIKLWDVKTGKRLHRFAGHHSQVTALAFVPGKQLFVSGGGDRFVSVWRLDGVGTKTKTPVALLSLQYNASALAVMRGGEDSKDEALMLAVATNADKAYVWRVEADALLQTQDSRKAALPQKPKCELVLQKELSTAGSRMMGVYVSASGSDVLLAHGTGTRPVFENAELFTSNDDEEENGDEEGGLRSQITIGSSSAAQDSSQLIGTGDAATQAKVSADRKRINAAQRSATTIGIADSAMSLPRQSDAVLARLGMDSNSMDDGLGSEDEDANDDDRPLALRVRDMTAKLLLQQPDGVEALIVDSETGGDADAVAAQQQRQQQLSAASSLTAVLEQALQSGDRALLEMCLQSRSVKVIRNTVRALSTARVVDFLKVVVHKFEVRPSRGAMLLVWIRAVLESHTAFLLTVPDLAASLTSLYQAIESRVATYKKLAKLSGRLDFLMSQISNDSSTEASAQVPTTALLDGGAASTAAALKRKARDGDDEESDEDDDDSSEEE